MQQLNQRALELAAKGELSRLECIVMEGPSGQHDLEISFPAKFHREGAAGLATTLEIDKTFIVEVKSHERRSASFDDLRQLQHWVRQETSRLSTPSQQSYFLERLRDARFQVARSFDGLEAGGEMSFMDQERDFGTLQENYRSLEQAIDDTMTSLLFQSKGIFLINHQYGVVPRPQPFADNIRRYAEENRLVLTDWVTLTETIEAIVSAGRDPLDFWCALYETNGIFELDPQYSWKKSAQWCYSLFDSSECTLVGGCPFLMPLPRLHQQPTTNIEGEFQQRP